LLTRQEPPAPAAELSGYSITSLLFALLFLSCCYNFFRAITLDPGTVRGPKPGSEELKEASSRRHGAMEGGSPY
jgi:hypothetical protein